MTVETLVEAGGRIGALSPSNWKKIVVAPLTDLAPPGAYRDEPNTSKELFGLESGRIGVKSSPNIVVAPLMCTSPGREDCSVGASGKNMVWTPTTLDTSFGSDMVVSPLWSSALCVSSVSLSKSLKNIVLSPVITSVLDSRPGVALSDGNDAELFWTLPTSSTWLSLSALSGTSLSPSGVSSS